MANAPCDVSQVMPHQLDRLKSLTALFGRVFDEPTTYIDRPPDDDYLYRLLDSDNFIALVAVEKGQVIGGLAANELRKFEQARSEVYIYDLAVDESYRRQGIATALIEALRAIAEERGAWTLFVQSDTGAEDQAAIALYSGLGTRENVLHFDIPVEKGDLSSEA